MKNWITLSILVICTLWHSFFPAYVKAGNVTINGFGGNFYLGAKSMKDMRFQRVVSQKYDFSCGSAALATLLTHHYDTPTEERTLVEAMMESGDKEKIYKEGFSLLDMKNYLTSIGLKSNGYKESLDKLRKVKIPAIVLINTKGYMHFVVIKGITNDNILVGDPAYGMKTINRTNFEKMWNGIFFVINKKSTTVKGAFNDNEDWKNRLSSPLRTALNSSILNNITINTGFSYGYY